MRGGFDERNGQIKIIQDFENTRVAQENAKSRIWDGTTIA
jgi:hypothetical protein